MATSLRLPESVHYRAASAAHQVVVPEPCFWVDRLSHAAQHPQALYVIPVSRRSYFLQDCFIKLEILALPLLKTFQIFI